jgi:hypothetical protein
MRLRLTALALLAALAGAPVLAQDVAANFREGVGLPMRPSDAAAGRWTLSTRHHAVCSMAFSDRPDGRGVYPARIAPECAAELPGGIVGWRPVTDGLALVGPDDAILVDFNQWTPTDLVARRAGAPFLELTR